MSQRFESHINGYDGTELFYQGWFVDDPQGLMIVTHGLGEHSESYNNFAHELNSKGWNVIAWDLRGHGRSEGQRGYVDSFNEFEKDLKSLTDHIKAKYSHKNLVLFGHSMGGLITLKYLVAYGSQGFKAVVLSSPALGVNVKVSELKSKMADFANDWLPRVTMGNEINDTDLHRDPELLAFYPKDPLRHNKISPRLYKGMLQAFEQMPQYAKDIQIPVLIQASGLDAIVNTESTQKFYELLTVSDKKIIIYPNSLHEIFNDLEKQDCFDDLVSFLNQIK